MNSSSSNPDRNNSLKPGIKGRSIVPVLLILAALGFGAIWLFRAPHKPGEGSAQLSDHTRNVIAQLKAPVEIRFYSGLPDGEKSAAISSFEEQVRNVLKAYESESKGKISLKEQPVKSAPEATAATQQGIRPQNLESGNALFMGLVLQQGDLAQVIPALSPDYAAALEPDITRALARIVDARKTEAAIAVSEAPTKDVFQSVTNLVPNYATVSVEEATRKLRETMLGDLQKAGDEFEAKMKEVHEALSKAEASGNPTEISQARKAITDAELAHNENLKQIVANSTAQLRALEQLKSGQK